jgi:hypothetical protein
MGSIEVCPEFTADVPGLKGEKVDYSILNKSLALQNRNMN